MCKAEEARKQSLILPLDGDTRPHKPGAICCAQTPSPWPEGENSRSRTKGLGGGWEKAEVHSMQEVVVNDFCVPGTGWLS